MKKRVKSLALRYGLGLASFVLTILIALLLRYYSIRIDLSLLVILVLIGVSWYGGKGPGLMVLILFELITIANALGGQTAQPITTRFIVAQFNVMLLFVILVVLVSGRRNSERRLREQRGWLEVTLSSIADAVIATDLDGLITFMNPAAEAMTGRTMFQAAGRPLNEVFRVIDEGPHQRADVLVSNADSPETTPRGIAKNMILISQDGTKRPIDYSSAPMRDPSGQSTGEVLVFRDITDRKRAEEALCVKNEEIVAMSQQLWQAAKLATMGELAASIAHELNNPLGSVSLRVESLLEETPPEDAQYKDLQIIEQEVERMSGLVANLLQFVRRSHPQISTLDLREEIDNTLRLIDYHLRNRQIAVVREFEARVPMIHADRQQLRQLFLNLITNASDAMPQGGTLTIRLGVSNAKSTRNINLEIADEGCGISPEDMPKLMEPFYTTKPEGKGTGLGLPICRRIVQEHNGSIDILSEVDKGTTVRITLPANGRGNGDYI